MAKAKTATKKVAKEPKKAKEDANDQKVYSPLLKNHDPKNREVLLLSTDNEDSYVITKVDTGFHSEAIADRDEAIAVFNHQIDCSQNQA